MITRMIAAALTLIALTGCTYVNSQVTSFHRLEPNEALSFAVAPSPVIDGSLEAETYAEAVAGKLRSHGWTQSSNPSVDVIVAYGIDGGKSHVSSAPVFGQTGGGASFSTGTVVGTGGIATFSGATRTSPTFGIVGSRMVEETVYTRFFRVDIYDRASGDKLYESRVISQGASGTFAAVASCLINALFADFPGESGKSKAVTLEMGECDKT
ncbi:MAG: DUF4136 domain-containing protein [Devosia sp.]|uniref:DUF4136 domain-containing protein n=1 Tax=Devosia sp. TaxID=1871048 RepID=UPI001A55092F|nr:DUF4136 domain-containing protein [Devosia sp.]MBL8597139.1 DUF4136 domain-containing protein [Devosia sp.]